MNLYKRLYVITRCVGLILLFLAGYGNLSAQEKGHSLRKTESSIRAAILKMPPIRRQTVRNGQLFLKP